MRAARPRNLEDAIWLAKNYEQGLRSNDLASRIDTQTRNQFVQTIETPRLHSAEQEGAKYTVNTKNTELDELRDRRLCFNYKERWRYGHK